MERRFDGDRNKHHTKGYHFSNDGQDVWRDRKLKHSRKQTDHDTQSHTSHNAQCFKTKLCMFNLKGQCTRENCSFAHSQKEIRVAPDLTKTKVCTNWKLGTCHLGESCRFAHGLDDLRQHPNPYTLGANSGMAAAERRGPRTLSYQGPGGSRGGGPAEAFPLAEYNKRGTSRRATVGARGRPSAIDSLQPGSGRFNEAGYCSQASTTDCEQSEYERVGDGGLSLGVPFLDGSSRRKSVASETFVGDDSPTTLNGFITDATSCPKSPSSFCSTQSVHFVGDTHSSQALCEMNGSLYPYVEGPTGLSFREIMMRDLNAMGCSSQASGEETYIPPPIPRIMTPIPTLQYWLMNWIHQNGEQAEEKLLAACPGVYCD